MLIVNFEQLPRGVLGVVPPENCDLVPRNFSAIWAVLTERAIFTIQWNFVLLSCPLDGRDRPVTANATVLSRWRSK